MTDVAGRRPTIKDVARHAGVSVSTVSYALNDSGPVAPDKRARVLAAVQQLGYAPNQSARSLKRRRVSSIGLIVPDLRNEFFALVAEGVVEEAQRHDVTVVLCSTDATAEREVYYAKLLRTQRLDGVIYLSGTGVSPGALAELAAGRSVVFVDERLLGIDVPFVGSENRRGAREVAAHVLETGHERVAFVSGPPALWTSEQRLAGYREAVAAAGREPDAAPVVVGDYRRPSGYAAAQRLLEVPAARRPTAILCANDLMAIGVMEYCRDHGLEVPRHVSITGFDDVPLAALLSVPLTTVRQPAGEMGQRAAQLLLAHVAGAAAVEPADLLPTVLQLRASVAPPR
jgi:DNA-binding LacI/PurR family transcriptional regulator